MPAFIKISDNYTRSEKRKAYEDFWKMMMPIVGIVVTASFEHGPHAQTNGMTPTRAAIAERVDICKTLVDTMRQEKKWSKWRIRDTLPYALRCHLSGIVVPLDQLNNRGSW